jgi:hypothetical protein
MPKLFSALVVSSLAAALLALLAGQAAAQDASPQEPASQEAAAQGSEPYKVPAPKISFDSLQFEGGNSPAGTTITHDFQVTNEGDDALLIYEAVPGCGCTVVSFDKMIPPGKTGKITVNLDLYREWAGQEYYKSVTVISNDPLQPRLRLIMRGTIGAPVGETLNPVTPPATSKEDASDG